MTSSKRIGAGFLITALLGLAPTVGQAVVFDVNSTVDAADTNPGDGVCDAGRNRCTLRAAIQERNAGTAVDTIVVPAGVYTLTLAGTGEDAAATGDLDITLPVIIKGLGKSETLIDAAGIDRVFDVFWAGQGEGVQISSLTVRNGDSGAENGGGVRNQGTLELIGVVVTGSRAGQGSGGGVHARLAALFSRTTIIDSDISGNQALIAGGGVYAELVGTLSDGIEITGSAISDNNVAGASGSGGGIYAIGSPVSIIQSTVSGNTAPLAGGGIYAGPLSLLRSTVSGNTTEGDGGGIYGVGLLTLGSVTVAGNTAGASGVNGDGGGVYVASGSIDLQQSILAGNIDNSPTTLAPDCGGIAISSGYNLIGDGTGCSGINDGVNGDQVGTTATPIDPQLGALAFNGGTNPTHALASLSPALDAGAPDCPTLAYQVFDQRGATGNSDGDGDGVAICDIGAYEFQLFNQRPVARAVLKPDGIFQRQDESSRETVVLNGSRSFDPDGLIVSYQWRQISGTTNQRINIRNADSPIATFTAPRVPEPFVYQYTFELTVTDTNGVTDTDQVQVNVLSPF